uniref:Uncharacterized protein n=1 Tax=Parascaris equorum TaxID=6256 RepID=A0A914S7S6_PAREQ
MSDRMNGKIGVYASADTIQAQRDIRFFFTDLYNEKKFFDNTAIYFNELILPRLGPALAELSIRRPDDPIVSKWLALFLRGEQQPEQAVEPTSVNCSTYKQ